MKKRILVVDDEISIRMGIREFAEYQGYDVTGAANGREAGADAVCKRRRI